MGGRAYTYGAMLSFVMFTAFMLCITKGYLSRGPLRYNITYSKCYTLGLINALYHVLMTLHEASSKKDIQNVLWDMNQKDVNVKEKNILM